jgi:hypothetical protein
LSSFQTYTAPSPSTMSSLATTLASYGYVSTSGLVSTVDGLGETYTSTLGLVSTVMGLATVGYISSLSVTSSIQGLGSSSYVSTASLVSTTTSLLGVGTNAGNFVSTTAGLGQLGYVSTLGLNYTVNNLGTVGYVSTLSLVSTTLALSTQKANIRFDNTGSVTVIDSVNTFTTTGSIIYVSTFFTSSIPFVGNTGTQFAAQVLNNSNLRFSTATLNFSGISSFVDSNSRVTIDIYPHIAFSKLATGANNVAILPISTFLQYGQCNLLNTTVNSYVYAGNTYMIQSNAGLITYVDASNFFNSPIKMSLPQGTLTTTGFTNPYTVVHYMPGGLNYTPYLNALHNCNVTPYFGSTNSLFISVQNIV